MNIKTINNEDATQFNQYFYIALRDAFNGSGGFASGEYLTKFIKEDNSKFRNRQELSSYDNNLASIVKDYVNPITHKISSIVEDNAPEEFQLFNEDCDGSGKTFRKRMDSIQLEAELMGFCLIYFTVENDEIKNKEEQLQRRIYPKLNIIKASDLLTRPVIDKYGRVLSFTFRQLNMYGVYEVRYYGRGIVTRTRQNENGKDEKYTKNFENGGFECESGNIEHTHSPVFIYSLVNSVDSNILPTSEYVSTFNQALLIYKLDSIATYQSHDATFQIFVCTDKTIDSNKFKLGENSVISINEGTDFKAISTAYTADKIRSHSSEIKENMYQDKNLSVNISSMASGISREYADKLYTTALQEKAETARSQELLIVEVFYKLIGQEFDEEQYILSYPKDFTPNAEEKEIDKADKLINVVGIAPENEVIVRKRLLTNIFSNLPNEEMQQVLQNEDNNINSFGESDEDVNS